MTDPLNLPRSLKSLGRAVRDNRTANNVITRLLRVLVPAAQRPHFSRRAPRLGPVSAVMPNGKTLRLHAAQAESIHSSIFYEGWTGQEPEVLPLWAALAERASTILDIGAHIGHFSLVAGLNNRAATIHSFEPHPLVASILAENVRLNQLDRLTIHQHALGRCDTTASFFVIPDTVPSSSSLSEDFMRGGHHGALAELTVPVRRLDDLLPDLAGPLLIKIDTETTEPDVLAGAARTIARTKPIIFIEILASPDTGAAIERELDAAGYQFRAFLMTSAGLIPCDRLRGDAAWRNYVLIPPTEEVVKTWGPDVEAAIHRRIVGRSDFDA